MTEKEFLENTGKRIKELRTKKGLSQKEVAERAGIYRADLSALENGKEKIKSIDIIRRIVEATGHDIADLFPPEEKKRADQEPCNDIQAYHTP